MSETIKQYKRMIKAYEVCLKEIKPCVLVKELKLHEAFLKEVINQTKREMGRAK